MLYVCLDGLMLNVPVKSHGHVGTVSSHYNIFFLAKIESEYDQEIPQSQTVDNPMAPRGRATQQSRGTRKTN